jgi:hypothetical protein
LTKHHATAAAHDLKFQLRNMTQKAIYRENNLLSKIKKRERERERRKFTSTVGFPLLSKIWRALIDLMIAIANL